MPETVKTKSATSDQHQNDVAKKLQPVEHSTQDIPESPEDTGKTMEHSEKSNNAENPDSNTNQLD